LSEMPPNEPTAIPPTVAADVLPWEASNAGLGTLFPTAARFLGDPSRAFRSMSLTVDLVRPIAYFVAFVLAGAIVSQFWSFVLWDSLMGAIQGLVPPQFQSMLQRPSALQIALGLVISPLVSMIILFVWTAVVHLVLALLGGASAGFAATLRTMCYARTADVATVVPVLGGVVGFVWRRVLEIIGLSQVHRTEGWKAALAVVVPICLCCLCVFGGALVFGAALSQALQQLK
jgi:hypothetical protein